MYIKKFGAYKRQLNEMADNGSSKGLFVVSDEAGKEAANAFIKDIKSKMDSEESKKALDDILSKGSGALSGWTDAWEKRKELDAGELRKEGGWYFGKGAWRINSNKAAKLGMTPKWMTWEDPLQDEILENFFPELKGGEERQDSEEQEQEADSAEPTDAELDDIKLPDWMGATADQEELETVGESHTFKYIQSIYEQSDDFTLGPPENVEDDAAVVTPSDLVEDLVDNFNARGRYNVMIWGAPGIGKTQVVKQAAKKIAKENGISNLPVVIVTLAQMMPTDLGGIPLLFDGTGKGEGSSKMVLPADMEGKVKQGYTIPSWLPGLQDTSEGILFFDEINRADPDMLAASLTLLLDREAAGGKYLMPSGWRIWAAGNREMDGPVNPFEPAVASRFLGGHVHLVPTVESWIDWARSEGGYAKDVDGNHIDLDGVPQFFVPDEFLGYLKHAESSEGNLKHFDLDGKGIKTDYKRFYRLDKGALTSGGEGVSVGFATPRNWSAAWNLIYDTFMAQPKYQDDIKAEDVSTPNAKGIAALPLILQDKRDSLKMQRTLTRIVGANNAQDFMSYVKVLSRHSDADGTIAEKITNIFKDPKASRPLLNIPKVNTSERDKILSLVLSSIENKGDSFKGKEYLHWAQWCMDLVNEGKVDTGELAAHIKTVNTTSTHVTGIVGQVFKAFLDFKKTGNTKYRELSLIIKPFAETFREIMDGFNI
jgi:hypothetical protein